MPVFQGCDLRSVDPGGTEPAEAEDDIVEEDHGDGAPVCACRLGAERGEDDVDKHAEAAPE